MSGIKDILSSAKSALSDIVNNYSNALSDDYSGEFKSDYKAMNLAMALRGWRKIDDKTITIFEAVDEITSLDVKNAISGRFGVPNYHQNTLEGLLPSDVVDHLQKEILPDVGNRGRYVDARLLTYEKGGDTKIRLLVEGGPVHVIIGTRALKSAADKWELFEYSPAVRKQKVY